MWVVSQFLGVFFSERHHTQDTLARVLLAIGWVVLTILISFYIIQYYYKTREKQYLLGYAISPFVIHQYIQFLLCCTTTEILRGGGDVRNLKHLKPELTIIENNLTSHFGGSLDKIL